MERDTRLSILHTSVSSLRLIETLQAPLPPRGTRIRIQIIPSWANIVSEWMEVMYQIRNPI